MICLFQGGSTCDSLSDSGISDGDSEGAGRRAKRLSALRELARRLQAALAPNSPAQRAIAKVNITALFPETYKHPRIITMYSIAYYEEKNQRVLIGYAFRVKYVVFVSTLYYFVAAYGTN